MKISQLNENMYSNNRPKPVRAHTAANSSTGSNPATPDDVFVTASDDRPGLIAVSLKGRTAYIRPETALELAELLKYQANRVDQKKNTWHNDQIKNQAKKDWLTGTYNNPFPEQSSDFYAYDQYWNSLTS